MTTTFATATTTLKTVTLEFTTAPIIRSVARRDIPEYGLTEGQVFYMAYSATESKAQGKNIYHIVTWDYEKSAGIAPARPQQADVNTIKPLRRIAPKSIPCRGTSRFLKRTPSRPSWQSTTCVQLR